MNKIFRNIIKEPNIWGGIIPLQIFGIMALYLICFDTIFVYWWAYFIVGYICIMMLGISGCYHRLLSHKSYTVSRPVKILLLWFAALGIQGSAIFWVSIHRGYHHRLSDKDGDAHSPHDGFWHSYILWMIKITKEDVNPKYAMDLIKDKDCIFFHKHYITMVWISHITIALISFPLWLFGVLLPAFVAFHSFSINTSFNHYRFMGYRSFDTTDDSVNSIWTWFLTFGEAWHNNHHYDPKNPNYGKKWWELDPTFWLIKLIRNDKPLD